MSTTPQQILDQYLGGASYKRLTAEHGLSWRKLRAMFEQIDGASDWSARARSNREQRMQDTVGEIVTQACAIFGLAPGSLWRESKLQKIVQPRNAAWLICHEHDVSSKAIARAFEMDHSTVNHGIARARERVAIDPVYSIKVAIVRAQAGGEIERLAA